MPKQGAKVTTKTGDSGYTSLLGKGRVPKYDPRIEALGTLDEASSALGLGRALCGKPFVREVVYSLQKDLYVSMAELATSGEDYERIELKIHPEDVTRLETLSEELKSEVSVQAAFVVPGGCAGGAALDLARTVIRRAERQVTKLLHDRVIPNPELLRFLNRMSDLVFILARYEEAEG